MHADDEHSVVSYAVSCWHNTCIRHLDVGGCPHSVDWELPPEECGTDPFAGVRPYHLLHIQPVFLHQRLPNGFPMYVFVGVKAHYDSVPSRAPCFQQFNQVLPELGPRARLVIFLVHNKKSALLLVAGAAISISIRARVVPANYSGLNPLPL